MTAKQGSDVCRLKNQETCSGVSALVLEVALEIELSPIALRLLTISAGYAQGPIHLSFPLAFRQLGHMHVLMYSTATSLPY
jgi:hypothetical protein